MAQIVTYHLGGLIPAAPQKNRAELYDGPTATFTSWDTAGVQTATRALTAGEIAQLAAQDAAVVAGANQSTIQQQAQTALANNRTYLAIATPSTAQVTAQVRALTQQTQALIRLALQQFDATN